MGHSEQIGKKTDQASRPKRPDWLGVIAWLTGITFWVLMGAYVLKLFGFLG